MKRVAKSADGKNVVRVIQLLDFCATKIPEIKKKCSSRK